MTFKWRRVLATELEINDYSFYLRSSHIEYPNQALLIDDSSEKAFMIFEMNGKAGIKELTRLE